MPKQLFYKERIPTSLIDEFPDQPVGRVAAAERGEQCAYLRVGKGSKRDRARLTLADKLVECRLHTLRCDPLTWLAADPVEQILERAPAGGRGLDLPVGGNEQYGERREMLREMLGQLKC